jgi:hypothetical protein
MPAERPMQCPICLGESKQVGERDYGDKRTVRCPSCGFFEISNSALAVVNCLAGSPIVRARISHGIRCRNTDNRVASLILGRDIEEFSKRPLPTIPQQLKLLCRWLATELGENRFGTVKFASPRDLTGVIGAVDGDGVLGLISYATKNNYVISSGAGLALTPDGWAMVEPDKGNEATSLQHHFKQRAPRMYNLIVCGDPQAYDEQPLSFPVGRFLEHTNSDELKTRLKKLDEQAIEELKGLPTVFAYEDTPGAPPARVGRIKTMRVRQGVIRITFEFDPHIESFTSAQIAARAWEFDVNKLEMNRTHWAVKEVDLLEALREAGLGNVGFRGEGVAVIGGLTAKGAGRSVKPARNGSITIAPRVFQLPHRPVDHGLVAIMMPFERKFDAVHDAIVAACRDSGFTGQRVDDMWEHATIIQDVFSLIYRASIVVVDFSTKNPNVFYETGIAHTLGKEVVPITQHMDDVPFDLRHHRCLVYLPNGEGLANLTSKLAQKLSSLRGA